MVTTRSGGVWTVDVGAEGAHPLKSTEAVTPKMAALRRGDLISRFLMVQSEDFLLKVQAFKDRLVGFSMGHFEWGRGRGIGRRGLARRRRSDRSRRRSVCLTARTPGRRAGPLPRPRSGGRPCWLRSPALRRRTPRHRWLAPRLGDPISHLPTAWRLSSAALTPHNR
jgi:hypothetical protein